MIKFIIDNKNLKNCLVNINSIIPNNPTIPIFENILFSLSDNELLLTGSDGNTFLTGSISNIELDFYGDDDWDYFTGIEFLTEGKLFFNLIKQLPETDLKFIINESRDKMCLEYYNHKYEFHIKDKGHYPTEEYYMPSNSLQFYAPEFVEILNKNLEIIDDNHHTQALQGLNCKVKDCKVKFESTDLKVFLINEEEQQDCEIEDNNYLISKKCLTIFKNLLSNHLNTINIYLDEKQVYLYLDNYVMSSTLIDEEYLNFEALPVYNSNNSDYYILDKEEIISSVQKAILFSDSQYHKINFKFNEEKVILETYDYSYGKRAQSILEVLDTNQNISNSNEITLDCNQILKVLKHIPDKNIYMFIDSKVSPCAITGEKSNSYALLAPFNSI